MKSKFEVFETKEGYSIKEIMTPSGLYLKWPNQYRRKKDAERAIKQEKMRRIG